MNQVVTILQHRLLHYRVDFFQQLHELLKVRGIDLQLVHGQASDIEKIRKDEGYLSWAIKIENKFIRIFNVDLVWQPLPKSIQDSELIVLMQENRLISNYPFIIKYMLGSKKQLAFWGHGANFQSDKPNGIREVFKKIILTKVDWWFAYTEMTSKVLIQSGFSKESITCLNNAIDTSGFRRQIDKCSDEVLSNIRSKLNLSSNSVIGLYCGSLYPDKRLELMIAAADIIQRSIPEFKLIIIGDGPSVDEIKQAFSTRKWCHWVGVKTGAEKAAYYKLAKVNLNPGLVGLHVLDAFSASLPMVSTYTAKHSPEISYLENNINGLLTGDTPEQYSHAVIKLLTDTKLWKDMSDAAYKSSKQYTVENMAKNFADGIVSCLSK